MTVERLSITRDRANVTLKNLLLPWVEVSDAQDRVVTGIQLDSRKVTSGDVFIAVAGEVTHGIDYLNDVTRVGAAAVLVDTSDEKGMAAVGKHANVTAVPNLAQYAGAVVSRFFGDPSQELQVVGVTGTDGKTSLCHLLGQALNEQRNNCGIIGTLGVGFSDALQTTGLTTPDSVTLQSALAGFRDSGASYAAMEVSSHALAQGRTTGIAFDVAVLTNLGRDHLDYHGDMQSYRAAKESLFYQPQLRAAVVNCDDEFGNALAGRLKDLDLITYGAGVQSGQHVRYDNIKLHRSGISFDLEFSEHHYTVTSALVGEFNVSNLSAIFAVLVSLGVSPGLAADSIGRVKPVPGRMEVSRLADGVTVIVDYAHNPHALESALQSVAAHTGGRLLVVFGCGGDRDQGKRPVMAQIAENYADVCIVTDDNPRHENGDEIVAQILTGFSEPDKVIVERNRKAAILTSLNSAGKGDVVVVAGKGHEDYQLIGDQHYPFSDSEVVREYALELAS
ncbi:MAG: UDP-N-acetylmuramoyl-L-alanyl-D-glutamate--2,6-diaminopimelate ligase [Pseudomonadota bacterium]